MDRVLCLRASLLGAWPLPGSSGDADSVPDDPAGPSTEVALCELASVLGTSIAAVHASAAAARIRLESLRVAEGSGEAAAATLTQLSSAIDLAEATKTTALEAEQVATDAALEELQAVAALSVPEMLEALDADALGALSERLVALRHRLQALPRVPVEPTSIELVIDGDGVDDTASALLTARVVAPRALHAVDLELGPVPRFAPLGRPLHLSIISTRGGYDSTELPADAFTALAAAATYTFVAVRCVGAESAKLSRPCVTVVPDSARRCLDVAIVAPPEAGSDSSLLLDGIFVAGTPLLGLGPEPAVLPLRKGVKPGPLLACGTNNLQTPCVTAGGLIFVPCDNSSVVHVYDGDGAALTDLALAPLGLKTVTIASGYDDSTDMLVLSDCGQLVAVRLSAPDKVIWRIRDMGNCCGLAVLGRLGVVVAGSNSHSKVLVYSITDGALLAETSAKGGPLYVAADAETGTIFASFSSGNVRAFAWDGTALIPNDKATSLGSGSLALAVVPPAPGRYRSHLITCKRFGNNIEVFSLPSLTRVFSGVYIERDCPQEKDASHRPGGRAFSFAGVAADPSGTALVVGGGTDDGVHVVQWPLAIAGFPKLE